MLSKECSPLHKWAAVEPRLVRIKPRRMERRGYKSKLELLRKLRIMAIYLKLQTVVVGNIIIILHCFLEYSGQGRPRGLQHAT